MSKLFARTLGILLAVVMLTSMVMPTMAATYRTGAQSGPSSSYAGSRYYENYKRVPITGDNRTDLIAIALSQLGYQEGKANGYFSGEISGSANYVEFSYNMGDLGLGYGGSDYPWCASFVSWCLYQSRCTDQSTWKDLGRYHVGDYTYIWKEISCSQWVRQLKGAGYYKYSAYEGGSYTPKYGDLVFFQNSGGVAHIGICLYVSGGRIYTVEGNTSDSAGLEPNGGGVYFKNYSLSTSYINGYGVLPYKSDSSVTKIDYSGNNPTPGLYIANAGKYIYGSETDTSYDYILPRFTMFEVTQVCSNGRLKITGKCSTGETVTGYILNNSDRVIQLSSTATDAVDTARTNLQTQIKAAAAIRHYNYTEAKLIEIGTAYDNAVALAADTSATADAMNAAAATLRNLMGQTGSNTIALNNKGVYINGRNSVIGAGDCFMYSYLWNDGLITVDNANIRYTVNVVCTWDAEREINVVKSITYGSGSSTPSIQLGEAEWLIACHDWESGVSAGDNPVEYSGTNYEILSNLSVGDGVVLYGATALNANTDVKPGAFLKFIPKAALRMTAENTYVGNGQAMLFTPDFNSGLLTPANANIHQTLNVIAQWDDANSAWVVTEKFAGNGVADETSNIEITDGQVVIACHAGTTTSHAYGWRMLNAAQVGQKVIFSGISPTDGSTALSKSANISFVDLDVPETPEEEGPVNLASGKDVTVTKPGTAAHTANLTDGVYVSNLDFTGGWFGFMGNSASANCNTVDGVGTAVIDLGGRYSLSNIRAHFYAGANEASVGSPSYIKVYISANGTSYGYVGELVMDAAASEAYWAELEDAGATGRYVKFEVGPGVDASWVFLNELEIYGTEPVDGHNIALGAAQQGTPSSGYDASLTDGIVGEAIDDGNWYGIDTFLGNGNVIIDLNERFQISSIKAHIYAGEGVVVPTSVSVSISADGVNYAKVGVLPLDSAAAEPFWAELTADTMVGRYVMLEAASEDALVLLSEVQVCGMPYVQSSDNNIAMGKDMVVSPYADSPFTALLNDSLASEVFQYNVNNSAWFGFMNTGDAATSNVTNNRGIVTIDLGGQAEITGVAVHLFAGANDASAVQPQYINVYYSPDGIAYDYAGYINPDTTQTGAYWMSADYSGAPVTARFLKVALGTNVGDLVLLNEIKVSGLMLTEEDENEPGSVSAITLAGSFNSWNSTPNMVNVDETTVTTTVTLEAGDHEFKVLYCNQWLGNNGTIIDTTGGTGWVMEEGTNNCILSASRAGVYRFTFNKETSALKVVYVPDQLYLRGSFNEWGTEQAMEDAGNGIYKASLTLEGGSYEFKVANADYSSQWPVSNYVLELAVKSDVTVTLDIFSGEIVVDIVELECNHSYESGVCTKCGEADPDYVPVVAPTISLAYPTLLLEDVIKMNVYFTLDQDIELSKLGMLTWTSAPSTVDINTADAVIPGAIYYSDLGYYGVTTEAIPAQNLGDTVYFCIYAELADGTYAYGKQVSYSPTTYAYNQLKGSATDAAKSLYVAILNYGAAAQTYLSYNTDALINASLTDEMRAYVNEYSSDMVHSVSAVSATKQGTLASNGGFSAKKPSISLDGAFAINYYFTPSAEVSGEMTFYYWNAADFAAVDVLSIDNATGSATMTADSGVYGAAIEGIAAKDIDGALYACGVYTDANGNTYSTGILPYSLGVYCGNQAVNGTEKVQPLAAAIAVYGYYAANFFAGN